MPGEGTLKIKDTVSLNSGGHIMTVVSIDNDSVTCAWSVNGNVKSQSFPELSLKKTIAPKTLEQLIVESRQPEI